MSSRLCRAVALLACAVMAAVAGAASTAYAADAIRVTPRSRIQVIYFSAADCPYCRRWEAPGGAGAAFLASALAAEAEFYGARRPTLLRPPGIGDVPQAAQWVWDRAWIPRGTPAWLVAVDETVVLTVVGLAEWDARVLPLIERLTERRRRLRP